MKRDLKVVKCYKSNEYGHYAKDCKIPKKNYNNEAAINYVKNESILFQVYQNEINSNNKWIMNSAATDHICCIKENFEYIEPFESTVIVGDGRRLQVEGIGCVKVKTMTSNGKMIWITITKVLYVPELCNKVISVGKLVTRGFYFLFERENCKINLQNVTLVAKRSKWNQSYELCTIPITKVIDVIKEEYSKKVDFYLKKKKRLFNKKLKERENSEKTKENQE